LNFAGKDFCGLQPNDSSVTPDSDGTTSPCVAQHRLTDGTADRGRNRGVVGKALE
jgi:hypothetical protein